DRRLQRHQAAGVDAQRLAGLQLERVDRAAGVDEAEPVALQPLHDEAFTAEQAHADLLLERYLDRHAARRTQERILLADDLAAHLGEVERDDLACVGRGERHALAPRAAIREHRHEQALAGQQPLAGPEQRPHDPAAAARLRLAAVAEDGLHLDALLHVHQGAGLGDRALAGIQDHLDELHLVALDLEVDVVGAATWRGRLWHLGYARAEMRLQLGHVPDRGPLLHAIGEYERLLVDAAVLDVVDDLLLAHGPDLVPADRHEPLLVGHLSLGSFACRVDPGRLLFLESLGLVGAQAQPVRELRQVDTLRSGDGLVGAHDRESQYVEIAPLV